MSDDPHTVMRMDRHIVKTDFFRIPDTHCGTGDVKLTFRIFAQLRHCRRKFLKIALTVKTTERNCFHYINLMVCFRPAHSPIHRCEKAVSLYRHVVINKKRKTSGPPFFYLTSSFTRADTTESLLSSSFFRSDTRSHIVSGLPASVSKKSRGVIFR